MSTRVGWRPPATRHLAAIGAACQHYEQALLNANRVDFAHLQRLVYDMLDDPARAGTLSPRPRYLLVDEYQDTNYIQEQLLLKLAGADRNLCVVGDEDQSLYRFRGATVRNILEFPRRVTGCTTVALTTNYRSHRAIVERYDRWMASADWSGREGGSFRHDKTIAADLGREHPDYPAVIGIWGRNRRDEAERFADLVSFLKGGTGSSRTTTRWRCFFTAFGKTTATRISRRWTRKGSPRSAPARGHSSR